MTQEIDSNESIYHMEPSGDATPTTSSFLSSFLNMSTIPEQVQTEKPKSTGSIRFKSMPHFLLEASKNGFKELIVKELKKVLVKAIDDNNLNGELKLATGAEDIRGAFAKVFKELTVTSLTWRNVEIHQRDLLMTSLSKAQRLKYYTKDETDKAKEPIGSFSASAIAEANINAMILQEVKEQMDNLQVPKLIKTVNINTKNMQVLDTNLNTARDNIKKLSTKVDTKFEEADKKMMGELDKLRGEWEEKEAKLREEIKNRPAASTAKPKPNAQSCLQEHIRQRSVYRKDVARERNMGRVRFFFKDQKRYLVGDVNGEVNDMTLNYDNLQNDTGAFVEMIRFIKSAKGNWSAICAVHRPKERNADVSREIIYNRKSLGEGYFGVAPCHPMEHDISNTLLAWKDKGIIYDFDTIRAGYLIIILDDGNKDLEYKSLNYRKSCTAIKPQAPNLLATLADPTIEQLKRLTQADKFFVAEGSWFELDENRRNPKLLEE